MRSARLGSAWTWLAAAILLVAVLAADRLALLPAHVSFNPNEGWNAFQAAHALGLGGPGAAPLYPPPGSLTGDNYPPLSFYVVGWAGRIVGDPIVAGRIVALASVLAVAACVLAVVRRLGGGAAAAGTAALVFMAFVATQYRVYLAMDDPQWLGHALMSAGLLAVLPGRAQGEPSARAAAGAAALMALGGLVKHNLIAFPLATTAWLALHHRRVLAAWLGTAAAVLAAAAAAGALAYGPAVFADVLSGDRRCSWVRMVSKSALPVLAAAPLIGVTASLARARRADTRLDLLLLAAAIGVPLGVLQRSGEGVNVNAHFEGLIALCMAAGAALSRSGFGAGRPAWARPLPWLLAPFLVLVPVAAHAEARALRGRAAAQAAWSAMQARIAATPGRVACETQALCFWAGKGFELDVFLYGQHVLRRHDASALEQALAEHRFAAVELDGEAAHRVRRGDVANPVVALLSQRGRPVYAAPDGRRLLALTP